MQPGPHTGQQFDILGYLAADRVGRQQRGHFGIRAAVLSKLTFVLTRGRPTSTIRTCATDSTSPPVGPEPGGKEEISGKRRSGPVSGANLRRLSSHRMHPVSFAAHQDQDVKDRIREATDIVELIGSQLQLRRQGSGYVAHCPWHNDTRPSLQVNPKRQSWKCWVCDIGGDVFSFVMQREGVGFREALELLADRAGIPLRTTSQAPVPPGSPQDKTTLYRALQWAQEQFHRCLLEDSVAEPARQYLDQRGLSAETLARFRVGFSPAEWTWLVDRAARGSFSPPVLTAAGVCGCSEKSGRHYDRFRGRVLFPICDVQGRPIAFGGRVLPPAAHDVPKYVNSPETRLYSKSEQLYGLNLARDRVARLREIVVVEGYTDVMMAHQMGLDHVVAVCGTALGPRHLRLLKRFADRVVLVLDGDQAGQRRTNEVLGLFIGQSLDLRILTLPADRDPCEFLLAEGPEAFREQLAGAVDALEHKVRICTQGIDLVAETHRAHQALEEILATLAGAPPSPLGETRLREHQMLARLARQFGVTVGQLRQRLGELRRKTVPRGSPEPTENVAEPAVRLREMHPQDIELLEILVAQPEHVSEAIARIELGHIHSPPAREIFHTLHRVYEEGRTPDFGNVLNALEDPALKNIWVELDERSGAKTQEAEENGHQRLTRLIADYHYALEKKNRPHTEAALQEKRLDAQEELYVLQMLIAQERTRHGISGPKEG